MIRFHYFLWFLYWQISNIEHSTHIESFLRVFEEGNNLFMIFGTFLRYSIINLQKSKNFQEHYFAHFYMVINICYLPARKSVLGKTVPEVLNTA